MVRQAHHERKVFHWMTNYILKLVVQTIGKPMFASTPVSAIPLSRE
jgi:hypothetical protein